MIRSELRPGVTHLPLPRGLTTMDELSEPAKRSAVNIPGLILIWTTKRKMFQGKISQQGYIVVIEYTVIIIIQLKYSNTDYNIIPCQARIGHRGYTMLKQFTIHSMYFIPLES